MDKYKITRNERENLTYILLFFGIIFCGVIMRLLLFPVVSRDMRIFLTPWFEHFKAGGISSVGDDIGDYTPAYYYIMALLAYLPVPCHISLKAVSTVFDFLLAFYAAKTVSLKYKDMRVFMLSFGAVFCLPTVVLNSAAWGQCDGIFTAFLVMCLYYAMCGKDIKAMVFFGISVSFKIQAVFLAPFILILLLKEKIRWRALLCVPAVYIISIIPACIAGGNFFRLLTVYLRQTKGYTNLCLNIPNIWSLFGGNENEYIGKAGVFFAGAAVLVFTLYCFAKKSLLINKNTAVILASISAFAVPLLLPHMHERYFYVAEIMFVIFAFYFKKYFFTVFISQFCSLQVILYYLFSAKPFDLRVLLIFEIFNFAVLLYVLVKEMRIKKTTKLTQ